MKFNDFYFFLISFKKTRLSGEKSDCGERKLAVNGKLFHTNATKKQKKNKEGKKNK